MLLRFPAIFSCHFIHPSCHPPLCSLIFPLISWFPFSLSSLSLIYYSFILLVVNFVLMFNRRFNSLQAEFGLDQSETSLIVQRCHIGRIIVNCSSLLLFIPAFHCLLFSSLLLFVQFSGLANRFIWTFTDIK